MIKNATNTYLFQCPLTAKVSIAENDINHILALSQLARRESLLALEELVRGYDDWFLEKGIMLVVDGADPDLVKEVLTAYILSSFKPGFEYQRADIIADGVLMIQSGDSPYIIQEVLFAALGRETIELLAEDDDGTIRRKTPDANEEADENNLDLSPIERAARQFTTVYNQTEAEAAIADLTKLSDDELAKLLMCLNPLNGAKIISGLPGPRLSSVIEAIVKLPALTNPTVLQNIHNNLSIALQMLSSTNGATPDHIKVLSGLIRYSDRHTGRNIYHAIENNDLGMADDVRDQVYLFEDTLSLSDRDLQKLLGHNSNYCDYEKLALALYGASEELREHFLSNLSNRKAQSVREEMERLKTLGPEDQPRLDFDCENARQDIMRLVRSMIDANEILLPSPVDTE